MNFVNPYIEIYFRPDTLRVDNNIPFYKEVSWTFLKNIENRLKLFQHRVNIVIVDSTFMGCDFIIYIFPRYISLDTYHFDCAFNTCRDCDKFNYAQT